MLPVNTLFNKPLSQVSFKDVQEFFSIDQEETSTLEFKSGRVSLETIYKSVSAMLNTEGGLIIIGAPEEKQVEGDKRKVCRGDLTPSKIAKTSESLNQLLCSHVIPVSLGMVIHRIPVDDGGVFLVDVPKSLSPPHQVSDSGAYYLRVDKRVTPAPHGLVEALFNRRRQPNLVVDLELVENQNWLYTLTVFIRNLSQYPADGVSILVNVYGIKKAKGSNDWVHDVEPSGIESWKAVEKIDTVLATSIHANFDFEIEHPNRRFMVRTIVWSKEANSVVTYWIVNSGNLSIKEIKSSEISPELIKEMSDVIGFDFLEIEPTG
jgi:hypothetical protein